MICLCYHRFMSTFSQRNNYILAKQMTRENLDNETRIGIWNILMNRQYPLDDPFTHMLWGSYFKRPIDEAPIYSYYATDHSFIKQAILTSDWYVPLDISELFVSYWHQQIGDFHIRELINTFNNLFEIECCAYRFMDNGKIVEITSKEEIDDINQAINEQPSEIKTQLNQALAHLSDRKKPDYRNSIKESISAIETLCRKITGEITLGKAIHKMEHKGLRLNSQFKDGLEKIYAFTNGPDGIRHALMEEGDLSQADARFMLVLCSAFINYISVKMQIKQA